MRAQAIVGIALLLVLILTACGDSAGGELALTEEEAQTLTVHINAGRRITFAVSEQIELPSLLGAGKPDDAFNPTSYYGVPNTLTIRIGGQDLYFDLHNTIFRLEYRSNAFMTSDLIQYGKDLILVVEPGLRSTETVTLIAINERIKTEGARIVLEYLELDSSVVRVFFEALPEPAGDPPAVDLGALEPRTSCLHEIDGGFLGIAGGERFEYFPADVRLTLNDPDAHIRGYAEYPRYLLRPNYEFEFRYACIEDYAFKLPFKFE